MHGYLDTFLNEYYSSLQVNFLFFFKLLIEKY